MGRGRHARTASFEVFPGWDYTTVEVNVLRAADEYRRKKRKLFLSVTDVMDLLKSLGWREPPPGDDPMKAKLNAVKKACESLAKTVKGEAKGTKSDAALLRKAGTDFEKLCVCLADLSEANGSPKGGTGDEDLKTLSEECKAALKGAGGEGGEWDRPPGMKATPPGPGGQQMKSEGIAKNPAKGDHHDQGLLAGGWKRVLVETGLQLLYEFLDRRFLRGASAQEGGNQSGEETHDESSENVTGEDEADTETPTEGDDEGDQPKPAGKR